ncbi:hypothetical protein Adt_41926 [Abeliophyllum distichum]|uniref:Uncharacterized protein n=1 Tax=Abeliophyllum distichum TaxID=126358 RepID=A0ABD1PQD1_9LAMI
MNLIRELVLTKEVCSTLKGFDGKLRKEEANSKKLSKDLKAMSHVKAQLESDKRFLQVRLDSVVAKETDLKAIPKIGEERALVAEIAVATVNCNFEAMVVEKDKLLVEAKEEVERVKADCANAEARALSEY